MQSSGAMTVSRHTYVGLGFITLATLMFQILLTRIFSVTMAYHFAFMAVSTAMFGLTLGAILVYLLPQFFREDRANRLLAWFALACAFSTVAGFAIYLQLPTNAVWDVSFHADAPFGALLDAVRYLGLTYLLISIPFTLSGVVVCIALTKAPLHVSRLYAADLLGAAIGCVALVVVLRIVDGPTAVVVVAAVAATGSLSFAFDDDGRGLRATCAAGCALLWALVGAQFLLADGAPWIRLVWAKEGPHERPLYEKWNSFAYFQVRGDPRDKTGAFGWGMGSRAVRPAIGQLSMRIDAGAGTVMTRFSGDTDDLGYLRYDVTNVAHEIRSSGPVLVVGVGGGRDILSALHYGHEEVVGVEINGDLLRALNGPFGTYTGHLDRNPRVRFVEDEARSYISRQTERFELIQISLIDTWAATAAGAFVLTENTLYTTEAWRTFIDRLQANGLLTVSRWYSIAYPAETQRLVALAAQTLLDIGISEPGRHIAVLTNLEPGLDSGIGVGTLLLSRAPLREAELDRLELVAKARGFRFLVSPRGGTEPTLQRIADARDLSALLADLPHDVSPPTDDRPFFFNTLRLRDVWRSDWLALVPDDVNVQAVRILAALLIVVVVLLVLCVVVPLAMTTRRAQLAGSVPWFVFFGGIGFGFMLVEISQMQRLTVFLGHPVYGLSVVLFSLLLGGGAGSYLTQRIGDGEGARGSLYVVLGALIVALVAFGIITPWVVSALRDGTTPVRIAAASAILAPLGMLMGTMFPIGMRTAARDSGHLTPWLWGINGAAGVCASVIAVAVGITAGIGAAFWLGTGAYVAAAAALLVQIRRSLGIERGRVRIDQAERPDGRSR